ncbi:hypothetical protein CBL_08534 [Carabus blaptoides fortunei]
MGKKDVVLSLAAFLKSNFADTRITDSYIQSLRINDDIIILATKFILKTTNRNDKNHILETLKRNTESINSLIIGKQSKNSSIHVSSDRIKILMNKIKEKNISDKALFKAKYNSSSSIYGTLCRYLSINNNEKNRLKLMLMWKRNVNTAHQYSHDFAPDNKKLIDSSDYSNIKLTSLNLTSSANESFPDTENQSYLSEEDKSNINTASHYMDSPISSFLCSTPISQMQKNPAFNVSPVLNVKKKLFCSEIEESDFSLNDTDLDYAFIV